MTIGKFTANAIKTTKANMCPVVLSVIMKVVEMITIMVTEMLSKR